MRRAFANEPEQRAFRAELEQMLRRGEADAALSQARARAEAQGPRCRLTELTLAARVEDISLTGWNQLAARIRSAAEYGNEPVTALSINFSWPGHLATSIRDGKTVLDYDPEGGFTPVLETNYLGDMRGVKFSVANRDDILKGYNSYGSEWQGSFIDVDNLIGVAGMEPLYGAIQASDSRDADSAEGDAYVIAACTSAILLHLAVARTIETQGLPKPMAVLVGSNEDFPFFDAPVMSVDESAAFVAVFDRQEARRHAEADAARARAEAAREQENAERTRFDPIAAMEHFGEAAKVGQDIVKLMRKEKDIFLGIGAVGLAVFAHALRNRK